MTTIAVPPVTGELDGGMLERRTARLAGLLYLAMVPAGALGFLMIRPRLYDAGSADATLATLAAQETLARVGIGIELCLVVVQALAAVWFFRLFRRVDSFAAGSIAAFGLVNAVAVMVSAALLGVALDAAIDPSSVGDPAGVAQASYSLGGHLWTVGGLFFGLWLVPMGWCALRAGMPRVLGWVLIAGGVGYVASTFAAYLAPAAVADVLVLPATVGELWMIGYLLWAPRRVFGRRGAQARLSSAAPPR